MSSQEVKPDFISVYEQAGGVKFSDFVSIPWLENPLTQEYKTTIRVRVRSVSETVNKCEKAWQAESGIFFQYPGFRDGLIRSVRIVDVADASGLGETGGISPAVELTVVLQKDDHADYLNLLGNVLF